MASAFLAAAAEEMPLRLYTTSDGLVRNRIFKIRRDSQGFLWFATAEGVSIFDGYQFTNYTADDGLPSALVNDVLETQSGDRWIATPAGISRFNLRATSAKDRFLSYSVGQTKESNDVNALVESRDHSIWLGTDDGLWRLTTTGGKIKIDPIPLPWTPGKIKQINCLLEDRRGILWVGAEFGLYALWPDGRSARFSKTEGLPGILIHALLEDSHGNVWLTTPWGFGPVVSGPQPGKKILKRIYTKKDGLPSNNVVDIFQTADGKLWIGSFGLFEFRPDATNPRERFHSVATSLESDYVFSPAEDVDHSLWAVIGASGAIKITRHGFTSFTGSDGLKSSRIHALTQNRRGDLYVIAGAQAHTIHRFDGSRFETGDLRLPPGVMYSWGETQFIIQDHEGDWWAPTISGVVRYPAVKHLADLERQLPKARYTTKQGLPANVVLRLFEDSRGDIWMGCLEGLARWERKNGRIISYSPIEVLGNAADQPARMVTPNFFTEDTHGNLWIGFFPFGLARLENGKFDFFSGPDGLPAGQIAGLYVDHVGRLWIASSRGGVSRIDDTTAARPAFHTYTTAQGLSSNQVFGVAEDRSGLLYLSGGRGIDLFDVASGTIRRFPLGEGLPSYEAHNILRDSSGAIWFGSGDGLFRYIPAPMSQVSPRPPAIRRLSINGVAFPLSDLGQGEIAGLNLGPNQNNLRIEFASLHFAYGEVLRYQYRLEGADADWSPLTDQRTVNYANLAPKNYRFLVRAVNGDGISSASNAMVSFSVMPPFWRRWWFVLLALCAASSILYASYRYRLKQVVAIERIRTRLASDLHDDIGSGLVEIAIASEIAKADQNTAGTELMQQVGDRARQLRDSISDIVWSVDPRHDHLEDLVGRMRQNAFSLLESNDRSVEFNAPDEKEARAISLAADRRRHLLLVCKEALTNIARHADASHVWVDVTLKSKKITLEVRDDGRGFDPDASHTGLGLRSMKRRAEESGGELKVESGDGQGTRLAFSVPLD